MNEKELSYDTSAICAGFNEHCDANFCEGCIYDHCDCTNHCIIQYTHDILTGKMKLSDDFRKEEPKPTQPPSWCEAGAWVTDNDCKVSSIYEVVDSNATTAKCRRHSAFSFEYQDFETLVTYLKPVMFMPYTEEQAERIVRHGAIIYITTTSGLKIIERAERSTGKKDSFDTINSFSVTRAGYVAPNAQHVLIGGIPLGVPKVNEEAMKKE